MIQYSSAYMSLNWDPTFYVVGFLLFTHQEVKYVAGHNIFPNKLRLQMKPFSATIHQLFTGRTISWWFKWVCYTPCHPISLSLYIIKLNQLLFDMIAEPYLQIFAAFCNNGIN